MSKLIGERKLFYKKIKSVYCPILSEEVYFSAEGFFHLIYESNHIPRNVAEQILKLSFLKYAPLTVKNCQNITDTRKSKRKIDGRYKKVVYYELVYEFEKNKKVRVVLERVGNGRLKFKSVMPHDKKSKTKKRQRR